MVVVPNKHDGFTWEVGSYIADRSPFLAKDLKTAKFFNDRAEYDAADHDWLKHRDAAAYENDLAILREMGRGFNEPELNNSSPRSSPPRGSGGARHSGHAKSRSRCRLLPS